MSLITNIDKEKRDNLMTVRITYTLGNPIYHEKIESFGHSVEADNILYLYKEGNNSAIPSIIVNLDAIRELEVIDESPPTT